ncbi:M28 family peptidase [Ammonicoccus fulvus]|uniref:M28 family peptidase n=1 Tax=Ammonicoccus fulvus TaxID=3138240 RepID=A0ABZ3FSH9_9ACTN
MRLHRRSAAAAAIVLSTTLAASPALAAPNPNSPDKLAKAVTVENTMKHLQAFQAIADDNDGNRAAGTSGYEASAQYVEKTLAAAGYTTERQYFDFFFEQVLNTSLTVGGETIENTPMSYSPAAPDGGVTGPLATPKVATGCAPTDWAGFPAGSIAVVSRGICSFNQKSMEASKAGASAVIIYNNAEGALNGTLGEVADGQIPTTGVTQAVGAELVAAAGTEATFVLDKVIEMRQTFNILAETKTGRADNVVMLGAHLDGAPEGPGINDNGSGSAAILETAVQLGKVNKVNNKVRFAWWGAEELGLIGSTHYVNDLVENDPAELANIAGYLNFDMVASPNYIIGVYDANESSYPAPVAVPEGSVALEKVFTDYFDSTKQPWVDTEFSGRSDYAAFIENGIASTGLFTGADDIKTAEEVALFGGREGILMDPNYHTAGDDLSNVNTTALGINVKAIAYATGTLAYDTSMVNGKTSPGKSGKEKKAKKAKKVKPNVTINRAAA